VRAFIEVGRRELDEKDGGGEPALINAACSGHLDIVKVLVRAGAGVDVANSDGCAPLHEAAVSAVVAYLESKGGTMHEGVVNDEISVESM